MAWGIRRSLNLGPLRINVSKSGLGYSVGGRGFRIGRDAKGRKYTAMSIPGTGIYNRSYSKGAPKAPVAPYTPTSQGNPGPAANSVARKRLLTVVGYVGVATLMYLLISWFAHLL
jgi:hypothetical protein